MSWLSASWLNLSASLTELASLLNGSLHVLNFTDLASSSAEYTTTLSELAGKYSSSFTDTINTSALSEQLWHAAVAAVPRPEASVAALTTEQFLYVNQAGSSSLSAAALELDTVVLGLTLLTTMHAMLHHRLLLLPAYALVGAAVEIIAIRVAQSHCHAEALLMLSQCSSGSSVAVYVPALYACELAIERLPLHALARPFAAGLLLCVQSAPHLLLGAQQGWWTTSFGRLAEEGAAAAAASVLAVAAENSRTSTDAGSSGGESSRSGSNASGGRLVLLGGPIWTFGGASTTCLELHAHLAAHLATRFFDTPTLLPLLAAGLAGGLGAGVATRSTLSHWLAPPRRLWWFVRAPLALSASLAALTGGAAAAAATFYVPSAVLMPALLGCGVSQPLAVAALLLLLLVPVLLLPPRLATKSSRGGGSGSSSAAVAIDSGSRSPTLHPAAANLPRTDALLFAIPLWQHAYLLVWPAWLSSGLHDGTIAPDLYVVVVVASCLSLAVYARASLVAPQPPRCSSSASRLRSASADGRHGHRSSDLHRPPSHQQRSVEHRHVSHSGRSARALSEADASGKCQPTQLDQRARRHTQEEADASSSSRRPRSATVGEEPLTSGTENRSV